MTALLLAALVLSGLPEQLHQQGRYHAAATEYQRRLFFGSTEPAVDRLRLAMSLAGSGETGRAARALRTVIETGGEPSSAAAMALAGLYERTGDYPLARFELLDGIVFSPDSSQREQLSSALGWVEAHAGNWTGAAQALERAGRPSVAEELRRIGGLHPKDPTLAIILSSFLPGAGEIYAGRPLHGLASLLVTGSTAAGVWLLARDDDWVSAAVLFSLVFLRFYDGSRRNAGDFAEDFNLALRRRELDRLARAEKLEPDWFGRAEFLTGIRFSSPGTTAAPASAPARPE